MKTGVLLVNLGTPASCAPKDVYRYLIEFLTDGRVIDAPWLKRQLLVRGVIVPARYKQSAKAYKAIWTKEGSPLLVHGKNAAEALQKTLGEDFHVSLAMRYQEPSIAKGLKELLGAGIQNLIVLPLFPHYASATTGSVHQRVMEELSQLQTIPKTTFIDAYPTQEKLIDAFCAVAPKNVHDYDHVLFSFHGLPERHLTNAHADCLKKADCCQKNPGCYAAQCYKTAAAITEKLQLKNTSVAFQSRLGKDPWLQPYTNESIKALGREGTKKLLVFCPSFVADCLETTYEIGIEYAAEFKAEGGGSLELVPGLNAHPAWIDALHALVMDHSF